MEATQPLKTLLQVHLASDAHAVLHLPYTLSTLNAESLQSSEHIQKWVARISSLLLSKDGGARWAGLCIAFQTATISRNLMTESAQTWVGAAMPLLSKNESVPTLKAAIRLLRHVFTGAMDVPEYQRQVCIPNIPKFSLALAFMGEKNGDVELKVLAMETLIHLIPLYPSLHRASRTAVTELAMVYLNGSAPQALPPQVVETASRLHSVLHHTGGKVGAATQWQKSVDDTLAFCWNALSSIRTTFPADNSGIVSAPLEGDPVNSIPLSLDRLRVGVIVLRDLMHSSNLRPVTLPIGPIVRLCVALLRSTATEIVNGHVDPVIRSLEVSVIPQTHRIGCNLADGLVQCAGHLLTPHYSRLLFYIIHHLEQQYSPLQRLPFLRSAQLLLINCGLLHDSLLPSRLARAIMPSITAILTSKSDNESEKDPSARSAKSRKGKKRARGYEGDEVFKMTRTVMCPAQEDGDVILAALAVTQVLLKRGPLSPPVHSTAARLVLSLYISLPHIPPSLLSSDVALHSKIYCAVTTICVEFTSGTTSTLSKSLGLVVGTSIQNASSQNIFPELELLLHPRVPPLVRSLPHVETLSLFRAEESREEVETRRALHVGTQDEPNATPEPVTKLTTSQNQSARFTSSMQPPPTKISTMPTRSDPAMPTISTEPAQSQPPPVQLTTAIIAPAQSSPLSDPILLLTGLSSVQQYTTPLNRTSNVAATDVHMVPEEDEDEGEDEPMPSIDVDSDSD